MSNIGTGIAAGVSQTTYQAGDVNARKTKETREKDSKTKRLSDAFEQHMLALDEGDADGDQASAQLRAHELLAEHYTINPELDRFAHSLPPQVPSTAKGPSAPRPEALDAAPKDATSLPTPPPTSHLDIKA